MFTSGNEMVGEDGIRLILPLTASAEHLVVSGIRPTCSVKILPVFSLMLQPSAKASGQF